MSFDITKARDRFPALQQDQVFLDNAGGSQALGDVIESITRYLSKTNVQLGASYHTGSVSNTKYEEGYQAAANYINAGRDEIVLGGSTTQLFMNLASALHFHEGDEIILSKMEHETNVKPWLFMAERLKLVVKWWHSSKEDGLKLTPANLKPLLSPKVKFVACTHVSNILGTIHDVRAIADTVHEVGALLCVDGVSYAPHRMVDVKAFGVDFYSFSWYKVYGPHIAVLYASNAVQQHVKPMAHFFNSTRTLEDKIGFASSNYECTQSIPHIVSYLHGAFDEISKHEGKLQKILLDFLNSRPDIIVHGSTSASSIVRVPTISFTAEGMDSKDIVQEAEKISDYGFRWGHFYSKRLCDEVLGLGPNGVTRIYVLHAQPSMFGFSDSCVPSSPPNPLKLILKPEECQSFTLPDMHILGFATYGSTTPSDPVVFLFHGLPGCRIVGRSWDSLCKKIGARLITIDRPGCGLSTLADRGLTDWPEDVLGLADHLGIACFSILGASGGGPFALACTRFIPQERLRGTAVVCGIGPMEAVLDTMPYLSWRLMGITPWILQIMARNIFLPSLVHPYCTKDPSRLKRVLEDQHRTSEEKALLSDDNNSDTNLDDVVAGLLETFSPGTDGCMQDGNVLSGDWGFDLKEVDSDKVWLVHGDRDTHAPLKMAQWIDDRLGEGRLRVLEGKTHFTIWRDHSEEISR
ncbi:Nn.00g004580.m01.CDS01, partial [Neocucurbitaria sp. VM-36]